MKPYYQDSHCTIYHGDCRDVLPMLSMDVVLTDPPYGVRKKQRTFDRIGSEVSWDELFPMYWMEHVGAARVVAFTPGVVNLPRCPLSFGALSYRWTLAVHVTNGMSRGPFGYGNWIPCVVYTAPDVGIYVQQSDIGRVSVTRDKPNHPSPKPYAAVEWFLGRLPAGDVVDPFMGSGTTLLAAKNSGRKAVGIELEEEYCEVAVKRLAQHAMELGA